ncbi:MAG: hypothetical protein ACOCQO_00725 [Halanaerobiaceae bacterium]
MRNFLEMVEKFLVNFIVIGLILLISLQLIMRNDTGYQRIRNLENSIKSVFREEEAIEVTTQEEISQKGTMLISIVDEMSIPQVWMVKNGERISDFSRGFVEIELIEGDFLLIDAKFYDQPLWLEVKEISPNISSWHKGQQFRISTEEKRLGVVEFYEKL